MMHSRLQLNTTKGNIFALLFTAVGLTGVLGVVGMQTISGPVRTMTKVNQKNITENDIITNGRISILNATVRPDTDGDTTYEPAPFIVPAGCDGSATTGGCLPTDIGAVQTDPWGTSYRYCVWDHGGVRAGDATDPFLFSGRTDEDGYVIAVISAGVDKTFQTECEPYDDNATRSSDPGGLVLVAGGAASIGSSMRVTGTDDIAKAWSYAEAKAGSGGLWSESGATGATIDRDLTIGSTVAIDRTTGNFTTSGDGDFINVLTGGLQGKSGNPVTMTGGLQLDAAASGAACTDSGEVMYDTSDETIIVCDGSNYIGVSGDNWRIIDSDHGSNTFISVAGADNSTNTDEIIFNTAGSNRMTISSTGVVDIVGNTDIGGILTVDGNTTLGDATGDLTTVFEDLTVGRNLDVTGNAVVDGSTTLGDATGDLTTVFEDLTVGRNATVGNDLTVDTNTLFVDAGNNRVGVGTTSPSTPLHVMGSVGYGITVDGGVSGNATIDLVTSGTGSANINDASTNGWRFQANNSVDRLYITRYAGTSAFSPVEIQSNGNVGINYAGGTDNLTVGGTGLFTQTIKIGSGTCSAGADEGKIRYTTADNVQYCNGSSWQTISGAVGRLRDIGNVQSTIEDNDNYVLQWDASAGTDGEWEAVAASTLVAGGVTSGTIDIDDLSDGISDSRSVFLGVNSGINDDGTNNENTAVGIGSQQAGTTASRNVSMGYQSLSNNITGTGNVALGFFSLANDTNTSNQIAIGASALQANDAGVRNTAIGNIALRANTTGSDNLAVGDSALANNVTGGANMAIGRAALNLNNSGNNNIALGALNLTASVSASDNISIGNSAMRGFTTGNQNVAIGSAAGRRDSSNADMISSSNSLFLGTSTRANANGETNQIVIGHSTDGSGSNSVTLGNTDITKTLLRGAILMENDGVCTATEQGAIRLNATADGLEMCDGAGTWDAFGNGGGGDACILGKGQTWQSVSRTVGVSYQNTTGRSIMVATPGDNSSFGNFQVSEDGSTWNTIGGVGASNQRQVQVIIPDQYYYRQSGGNGGGWVELRDDGSTDCNGGLATGDILANLSCASGEIAQYDGTSWVCNSPITSSGNAAITDLIVPNYTAGYASYAGVVDVSEYDFIEFGGFDVESGAVFVDGQPAASTIMPVYNNATAALNLGNEGDQGVIIASIDTSKNIAFTIFNTNAVSRLAFVRGIKVGAGGMSTDTLSTMSCSNGEVPLYNGTAWICATPDVAGDGGMTLLWSGEQAADGWVVLSGDADDYDALLFHVDGNNSSDLAETDSSDYEQSAFMPKTVINARTTLFLMDNGGADADRVYLNTNGTQIYYNREGSGSADNQLEAVWGIKFGGGSGADTLSGLACTDDQVAKWNNATTAWECADVGDAVGRCVMGENQEWQDVAASRSTGTWYQNTTGRPIMVQVWQNSAGNTSIDVSLTPSATVSLNYHDGSSGTYTSGTALVPDNHYYRVTGSSIREWNELRGDPCVGGTGSSIAITDELADGDVNTRIQVEESPNEDIIRFDTAGTERMTIDASGNVALTSGTLDMGSQKITSVADPTNPQDAATKAYVDSNAIAIDDLTDGINDGTSVFLGTGAGVNDDGTNNYNTAVGTDALKSNTTGFGNSSFGASSLQNNTSGTNNTTIGYNSLNSNTTGNSNTAAGFNALNSNDTGNNNTALGTSSLSTNSTGGFNTAIGSLALTANTTALNNTATGYRALFANTTGGGNSAYGRDSLLFNSSGISNSAFGVSALRNNSTGIYNTAVGNDSLNANTTGIYNTASGVGALKNNTIGSQNTAIGALIAGGGSGVAGDMDNNTIIGFAAGSNFAGGTEGAGPNNNILLGYAAGDLITTGDNNIIIGYDIDPSSATASNELNIGDIILGNISTGDVTVTGNLTATSYLHSSDRRLKDQIKDIDNPFDLLDAVHGKHYVWKKDGVPAYGVIAQDVETVMPEAVSTNADTDMKAVEYDQLIAPMIEALKDVRDMVMDLMDKVAALFDRTDVLIEENEKLRAELDALKSQNQDILNRLEALEGGE